MDTDPSSSGCIVVFFFFLLFLFISFLSSLIEGSILSVNKYRVSFLASKGDKRAVILLELTKSLDKVLSCILFTNTLANTVCSILGAYIINTILGFGSLIITTIFLGFFIFMAFELLPKILGSSFYSEKIILKFAYPLRISVRLLHPVAHFLVQIVRTSLFVLGLRLPKTRPMPVSKEELRHLVTLSRESGNISLEHSNLLTDAISFYEKKIREVMVPKSKVISINIDVPKEKVLSFIVEHGYTRYPVKDVKVGFIGFVNVKDVISALVNKESFVLSDLIRSPFYVYEDERISSVLKKLQREYQHLALVKSRSTDEVIGLVTLEDIVEELVGEIEDEFDKSRSDT